MVCPQSYPNDSFFFPNMILYYTGPNFLSLKLAIHAFFYEYFFLTQPQCCLTFSWIELQILRRCCLIHTSIIILKHFIFTMLVSKSRPRFICVIYVIYFSSSFSLWLIVLSHEYKHTCSVAYFLEYDLLFLDDNVDEECE